MGKGTDRNEIHPTFRNTPDRLLCHSAACLGFVLSIDRLYGSLHGGDVHIIQHDYVYPPNTNDLPDFLEVSCFDLDLQTFISGAKIIFCSNDCLLNASRHVNMIVFKHNHIKQANPMVKATSQQNGP